MGSRRHEGWTGFSGTLILSLPVLGEQPGAEAPPIKGPPGEPQMEKTGATWGKQAVSGGPHSAAPRPHHCSTLPPGPGLLQRQGQEAGCPDQPQEEPHGWKTQEGSDPLVCLLLSGQPWAWSRVDSGPCSSPGPAKLGNHVTAKKCNWPRAQYWGWGASLDTWVSEGI